MKYQTINPATGELVKVFSHTVGKEIEYALSQAERLYQDYRRTSLSSRTQLLLNLANILEAQSFEIAALMALEMGKPLKEGEAEARKCASACRFFAENAESFLRNTHHKTSATESYVSYEPMGCVLAIMPWNFPFWQFFRFAAPTLAVGNSILLKHAPNTPQCALKIINIVNEAQFPVGLVQSVFLSNRDTGKAIQDYRVNAVTLTGSSEAGSRIGSVAGKSLKRSVLELGGSDPFIILDDADIRSTAAEAARSRCQNAGQSCIAAKRFIVDRKILQPFLDAFVENMTAMKVGDPLDADTKIGPLARKDLRQHLHSQVGNTLQAGAERIMGGNKPSGSGFYYPPTILSCVTQGSAAWKEELFGPVAAVIPFSTEEEAVAIANDTMYGLGASIWSADPKRAKKLIPSLDCGIVFVNEMVKSDVAIPFGGIKNSGYGRELARDGMLEFANHKSVWIK